jgi:predicted nuclease of restriction endonuclease-like (RecB) superfamily
MTSNNSNTALSLNESYKILLQEIKLKLQSSQLRANISVNIELINFYWEVGKLIIEQQKKAKWGDKLFEVLSEDLSTSFPDNKGFSKTNLKNMYMFASHYERFAISQALPDQLTWTHHIVLLQSINKEDFSKKQWYAGKVIENGWSYRQLKENIKSELYERQSNLSIKTTNFKEKLELPTSALAEEILKDPYKFHFLTIGEDAHEKEIHKGLLNHVKQFLMELGQGFALYGTNYPVIVSHRRFEIDLLMYNTKLHSYVVIEIKRGDFKPEHTGQLNFYLSAIDEQLKMPEDGPTIGILLCERKDRIIAEYALKRVESPIGISEYQLMKSLPANIQTILPTIEELEEELSKDLRIKGSKDED